MRRAIRRPGTRLIGYACDLGKWGPPLNEQVRMLRSVGCHSDSIWKEGVDGGRALDLALIDARNGDVFIVATILCLGSLNTMGSILADFQKRNVAFRALVQKFDSRARLEKGAVPNIIRAVEARRSTVSESILLGLQKARAQGRVGGRRPVLSSKKRAEAEKLIVRGKLTMAQIATRLGVSRRTLHNAGLASAQKDRRPKGG